VLALRGPAADQRAGLQEREDRGEGAEQGDEEIEPRRARGIGQRKETVCGAPEPQSISRSHVERQNLTMRMGMPRFTRLTNGFSKKVENHGHMVALHFFYYDFCRIHQTIRVTPGDGSWTRRSRLGA
jgi:hypothetical protein